MDKVVLDRAEIVAVFACLRILERSADAALFGEWSAATAYFAGGRAETIQRVTEHLLAAVPRQRIERACSEPSLAQRIRSRLHFLATGRVVLDPNQIAGIVDALAAGLGLFQSADRPSNELLIENRMRLSAFQWYLQLLATRALVRRAENVERFNSNAYMEFVPLADLVSI